MPKRITVSIKEDTMEIIKEISSITERGYKSIIGAAIIDYDKKLKKERGNNEWHIYIWGCNNIVFRNSCNYWIQSK